MKSPVVAFLSALLGAFLGGVVTLQFLDARIDSKVDPVKANAERAHVRLDGVALKVGNPEVGARFAAQEGLGEDPNDRKPGKLGPTELHFMVGQWDGTGTQTGWSYNYYRSLGVSVPVR